jgi:hypothetical protein
VLLDLSRAAVGWTLVAARAGEPEPPRDLRTLWETHPPDVLAAAAPDAATFEAARASLLADGPAPLTTTDAEAARARAFATTLLANLEAPRRRAERVLGQRWARILLAVAALGLVLLGIRSLAMGPNLAADKPWRSSSSWAGCPMDPNCAGLAFCTDSQMGPWSELDLGAAKTFHRIEVVNRQDCCQERAYPLVVEVSTDHTTWQEVGRRDTEFSRWTLTFAPRTARWVKFTVPKVTVFHLHHVAIR